MNHKSFQTLSRILTFVILVSLFLGACSLPGTSDTTSSSSSGISVWLDQSPDGWTLPLAPFTFKAHASDSDGGGITSIAFLVSSGDGAAVNLGSAATDPNQALAYGEMIWNPAVPGEYLIQAQAFSGSGSEISQTARICVSADSTISPTLGSSCAPSDPAQEVPITPTFMPSTPSEGEPVTPTFTPASQPSQKAQVSFTTDSTQLKSGECTYLHWNVQFATAVSLDGVGVGPVDQRQVCPSLTTTYSLHVDAASGDVDTSILINVSEPPSAVPPSDTTAPDVFNYLANPNPSQYFDPACGNTVTTFSATVSDSSELSTVRIFYSYGKGWYEAAVSPMGGGTYGASIDNEAGLQAFNDLGGVDGTITWYVIATDVFGNKSAIVNQFAPIHACPPG